MSEPNAQASSSKHHHKHRSGEEKHKSKHRSDKSEKKSKHGNSTKDASSSSKSYQHRVCRMRFSIPPKYSGDWLAGVEEILNGMLIRYVPQIGGVLLAHWNHGFLDDTLKIIDECPYGVCEVEFDAMVWAPQVGQRLYGSHSLSSPSHLSLLFNKTFNISIPLQHIPQDLYKFEHTSGEGNDSDSEDESDDDDELNGGLVEEVGRWRNVQTGVLVGAEKEDKKGRKGIKFTVIGMAVNNGVLSLTGSLLSDPTNPPPPPTPVVAIRAPSASLSPEPEPDHTARPAKQARIQHRPAVAPVALVAEQQAPPATEVIDDRFLSARDLKAKRKAEEKAKRDARKARKEEKHLAAVESVGAPALVKTDGDVEIPGQADAVAAAEAGTATSAKRKAQVEEGEDGKKKRKVAGA